MNDAASAAASNYTPATLDPSYKRTEADNQLVAALQSEADGRSSRRSSRRSTSTTTARSTSIEWGKGLSKNQALLKKYFGRGTATGARPMKELGAMFKKLDTNQDGFLSDEMVAAARGLAAGGRRRARRAARRDRRGRRRPVLRLGSEAGRRSGKSVTRYSYSLALRSFEPHG